VKKQPAPRKRKVAAAKPKAKKPPARTQSDVEAKHIALLAILESAEKSGCFAQAVSILRSAEKAGCFQQMLNWCISAEKEKILPTLFAEVTSAARAKMDPDGVAISKVQPSLLPPDSPEERGFTLVEDWRGLFRLYVRGAEIEVQMEPELAEVEAAILHGRSKNYEISEQEKEEQVSSLEQALWRVSMYNKRRENPKDLDERGGDWFQAMALEAVEMIGHAMSPHLDEFLSSLLFGQMKPDHQAHTASRDPDAPFRRIVKAARQAHTASCALDALLRRTLRRMTKAAFPWDSRANGSGDVLPKELLAIWHAKALCGHLRQLPTKTVVRERLVAIGVKYYGKNQRRDWQEMFDRAGLSELPD
jgi:hypothetical protein